MFIIQVTSPLVDDDDDFYDDDDDYDDGTEHQDVDVQVTPPLVALCHGRKECRVSFSTSTI